MSTKQQEPTIDKISDLSTEEAKWVEFKKINVRGCIKITRQQSSRRDLLERMFKLME